MKEREEREKEKSERERRVGVKRGMMIACT